VIDIPKRNMSVGNAIALNQAFASSRRMLMIGKRGGAPYRGRFFELCRTSQIRSRGDSQNDASWPASTRVSKRQERSVATRTCAVADYTLP
jgi:hypothetical protein